MEMKTVSLPRLNQLTPTLESTALKLMEEAGELAQVIGKFRGLSGECVQMQEEKIKEAIVGELLDVAKTAVTMMFVMEENYGVNIEEMLQKHIEKLERKKYLKR